MIGWGVPLIKIWHAFLGGSVIAALALGALAPAQAAPGDVDMPDANLRSCVNVALGQAPDAPITEDQAAGLTGSLECRDLGIDSLVGLEAFTSLTMLDFSRNDISDLLPLSGLVQLLGLISANNSGSCDSSVGVFRVP